MELTKIIKYLDKKFNEKIAAKWDNVGLQKISDQKLYGFDLDVNNVLVCLDVNQEVVNYAVDHQVQLIVSRHPFLFDDLTKDRKLKQDLIKVLVKNQIVIYSIHTNYDASPNQNLLNLLEQKFALSKTKRLGNDREGYEVKLKTAVSAKEFCKDFQQIFGGESVQVSTNFNWTNKVSQFGIVTGAGGSSIIDEQLTDCYFVTGEIKWHELVYANDHNVSVLILGHYMENYFINHLQQLLSENFHDLKVEVFDIKNQIKTI